MNRYRWRHRYNGEVQTEWKEIEAYCLKNAMELVCDLSWDEHSMLRGDSIEIEFDGEVKCQPNEAENLARD